MQSIRSIKNDISEISNLKDIAEILEAVSSITFFNLSNYIKPRINYFDEISALYKRIISKVQLENREDITRCGVFIGSDLVFCGNFNSIIKDTYYSEIQKEKFDEIILLGKQLRLLNSTAHQFPFPTTKRFSQLEIEEKNDSFAMKLFESINSDKIEIYHNFLDTRKNVTSKKI